MPMSNDRASYVEQEQDMAATARRHLGPLLIPMIREGSPVTSWLALALATSLGLRLAPVPAPARSSQRS